MGPLSAVRHGTPAGLQGRVNHAADSYISLADRQWQRSAAGMAIMGGLLAAGTGDGLTWLGDDGPDGMNQRADFPAESSVSPLSPYGGMRGGVLNSKNKPVTISGSRK